MKEPHNTLDGNQAIVQAEASLASNELTESLCHEGEKDWQIDQLLEYLHYDPETKSHPDWVARAQAAEAEVERLTRERQGWVDTAAEFARNMEYYQGLVDRIGRAIGREAYIADDGSVSQDVLRAKVPEIIERVLSERNQSPSETTGECPVCLGERHVIIGRRAIGQDSRVKALQMMYVEQPCPMCNAQKASDG